MDLTVLSTDRLEAFTKYRRAVNVVERFKTGTGSSGDRYEAEWRRHYLERMVGMTAAEMTAVSENPVAMMVIEGELARRDDVGTVRSL